jgi:RimJ/RimL family protein N-acetyltransferase
MKFMGKGDLLSEEDAWAKFQAMPGHWSLMGYGYWAITDKVTGAYLGNIGYADKKRPGEHPASGAPEMGWALAASAHGKGYASEALNAVLAWGCGHFGGDTRVVCVISDDNFASIRVAEKHGFAQFAAATRYGLGRKVFQRNL